MLLGQLREIDGLAVQPRRRAGLETADRQLQFAQTCGQRDRRRITHAAAAMLGQTHVNQAVEEGAGSQDHRTRSKAHAQLGHDTGDMVAIEHQVVTCLREDHQIGLVLEATADRLPVQHAICLRARRAHRRTLARIENPELDACCIGRLGHRPAQGIDFLDQMPLADAADRRVAAHRAECLQVVRQQQVLTPIRAAASAASVPAWPPPTTMTSKRSGNSMDGRHLQQAERLRKRPAFYGNLLKDQPNSVGLWLELSESIGTILATPL
jgi:hypothetical protein